MSRQRLSPSLDEASHMICPRCNGQGTIRNIDSLALSVLRLIQEEAMKDKTGRVVVQLPVKVATFLLNEKREAIRAIEQRHRVGVMLIPNESLETLHFKLNRLRVDELSEAQLLSYTLAEDFEEQPSRRRAMAAREFGRGTGGQGRRADHAGPASTRADTQARSEPELLPLAMEQPLPAGSTTANPARTNQSTGEPILPSRSGSAATVPIGGPRRNPPWNPPPTGIMAPRPFPRRLRRHRATGRGFTTKTQPLMPKPRCLPFPANRLASRPSALKPKRKNSGARNRVPTRRPAAAARRNGNPADATPTSVDSGGEPDESDQATASGSGGTESHDAGGTAAAPAEAPSATPQRRIRSGRPPLAPGATAVVKTRPTGAVPPTATSTSEEVLIPPPSLLMEYPVAEEEMEQPGTITKRPRLRRRPNRRRWNHRRPGQIRSKLPNQRLPRWKRRRYRPFRFRTDSARTDHPAVFSEVTTDQPTTIAVEVETTTSEIEYTVGAPTATESEATAAPSTEDATTSSAEAPESLPSRARRRLPSCNCDRHRGRRASHIASRNRRRV